MEKLSPFIYGKTVSTHAFTDREAEQKRLYANLTTGVNTMLISPRRWGKSSLVEKVAADMKRGRRKRRVVLIDMFSTASEEEFLELFAREVIRASSSRWQEWVKAGKDFFKVLIPRISVGVDPLTDFDIKFDWKELKKHSEEVLNLPELIGVRKNMQLVVCIDEFQNVATFRDFPALEKKMRAAWQRHKQVTYCLYGSKRHMMAELFNNPAKPFYRFGDIMLLEKIPEAEWTTFIKQGFAATGKEIADETAKLIPVLMKNHSWYVQQLAHYTWNLSRKKAEPKDVYVALEELLRANLPLYQKEVESVSATQLNLLKAVAAGETRFTSVAVMRQYQLGTPRNVSKNREILEKEDMIYEAEGKWYFTDPAFEIWFRRVVLRQPDFMP